MLEKKNTIESLKAKTSAENTQESFYRKSSKNFNSTGQLKDYGTIVQLMRSDILEAQSLIKNYSDVLIFFKGAKSLLPGFVQRRLTELEDKTDIAKVIDTIKADSGNIDLQLKIYNCQNPSELACKIALELNYYDLFIKKINDLAFLLSSRIHPDLNDTSYYQDTKSKFQSLKTLLESLLDKIGKGQNSGQDNNSMQNTSSNFANSSSNSNQTVQIEEKAQKTTEQGKKPTVRTHGTIKDLGMVNTVSEFMNFDFTDKNLIQLQNVIQKEQDQLLSLFNALASKSRTLEEVKANEGLTFFDQMLSNEKYIRLFLDKKDKKNDDLSRKIIELENYIKNMNSLDKVSMEDQEEKVKFLFKVMDDYNKIIIMDQSKALSLEQKLLEEIKDISYKYNDTNEKYQILKLEIGELKKQINYFNGKTNKGTDAQNFEELLQEQVENMKDAFIKKNQELLKVIEDKTHYYRRKLHDLEGEHESTTHLKDVFLKQITDMRKFQAM